MGTCTGGAHLRYVWNATQVPAPSSCLAPCRRGSHDRSRESLTHLGLFLFCLPFLAPQSYDRLWEVDAESTPTRGPGVIRSPSQLLQGQAPSVGIPL